MAVRAIVLVFVLVLSACSTERVEPASHEPTAATSPSSDASPAAASPSAVAPAEWEEPVAYTFTLESRCGWTSLPGRIRVTVENGEVVDVAPLDGQTLPDGRQLPTLGEILERAEEARRDGADHVEVKTDPVTGHPVSVEIDRLTNAIDDEECYEISDFGRLVLQVDAGG